MKKKIRFFLSFFLFFLICFGTGYFNSFEKELNIPYLDIKDAFAIFFVNCTLILLMIIISPTGLSLFFIAKTIFSIGKITKESSIEPGIFFLISLIHGLFEIICLYLVYIITLKYIIIYFKKQSINEKIVELKKLYFLILKKYLITIILLLLVGAFFEVFISNKIIIMME